MSPPQVSPLNPSCIAEPACTHHGVHLLPGEKVGGHPDTPLRVRVPPADPGAKVDPVYEALRFGTSLAHGTGPTELPPAIQVPPRTGEGWGGNVGVEDTPPPSPPSALG